MAGIDLVVERGSILAVLGPNGAGKSTLFGCLLGMLEPTHGQVLLKGAPVNEARRRRFGYVAERVALYRHRTVADNIDFFAKLKGHRADDARRQLERLGLAPYHRRRVCQLSKGLLQRPRLGHRAHRRARTAGSRRAIQRDWTPLCSINCTRF